MSQRFDSDVTLTGFQATMVLAAVDQLAEAIFEAAAKLTDAREYEQVDRLMQAVGDARALISEATGQ